MTAAANAASAVLLAQHAAHERPRASTSGSRWPAASG